MIARSKVFTWQLAEHIQSMEYGVWIYVVDGVVVDSLGPRVPVMDSYLRKELPAGRIHRRLLATTTVPSLDSSSLQQVRLLSAGSQCHGQLLALHILTTDRLKGMS